jgi:hypothetical protein
MGQIELYTTIQEQLQPNTSVNGVTTTMDGYQYRTLLTKIGNTCGLISNPATFLNIYLLPVITSNNISTGDDDHRWNIKL